MTRQIPTATYRVQLRDGTGFAQIEERLDYLRELGVSHLYLSPIMTATNGSRHGYDVTDPTRIDPAIGGEAGFERMARAAISRDIGIILDIVPNHTAFSLKNPWLRDVLVNGPGSRYARHFDIDWSAGPLVLPFLPEPFEKMLDDGRFSAADGHWLFDDVRVPLAAGTTTGTSDPHELRQLHDAQHWRLHHWEFERDGITHRRFFNVTSLIGMRVEDRAVFDDTHRPIFRLIEQGLIYGLRVDHIDGLADPGEYLDRLAAAAPDTPVWVEKILVGREKLPDDWQTAGTTGYEAARLIARLLTPDGGLTRLDAAWRQHTGIDCDFDTALAKAKRDVLVNELAAELHQLVALADAASRGARTAEPGPESLREAIIALLVGMTRYRTYIDGHGANSTDRKLIAQIVANAKPRLRSSRVLECVAGLLTDAATEPARILALRFQQVSGALLAKAQEDTAGFRWTRYLAANEVGAEPEEATVTLDEANSFLALRRPSDMTLTSTHDTKRSEDARMRLTAISHYPDAFVALVTKAERLPEAADVAPKWRWYIVQSALAVWGDDVAALQKRLAEHVVKAMREAKETTFWTRPVESVENPACRFAEAILEDWARDTPPELATLTGCGAMLSLVQLAVKCLMPGFPDFYRGTEGPFFALTDPDNRLPVDWQTVTDLPHADGFAGDKARLTRILLALRESEFEFLSSATAEIRRDAKGLAMTRTGPDRRLVLKYTPAPATPRGDVIWSGEGVGGSLAIFWDRT